MLLFSLLLSAGLDFTLPEFQPVDISGNYIVSSYDVSENEYIVTEISANDVSLNNVVPEYKALGADSDTTINPYDDTLILEKLDKIYEACRFCFMLLAFSFCYKLNLKILDFFGGKKDA